MCYAMAETIVGKISILGNNITMIISNFGIPEFAIKTSVLYFVSIITAIAEEDVCYFEVMLRNIIIEYYFKNKLITLVVSECINDFAHTVAVLFRTSLCYIQIYIAAFTSEVIFICCFIVRNKVKFAIEIQNLCSHVLMTNIAYFLNCCTTAEAKLIKIEFFRMSSMVIAGVTIGISTIRACYINYISVFTGFAEKLVCILLIMYLMILNMGCIENKLAIHIELINVGYCKVTIFILFGINCSRMSLYSTDHTTTDLNTRFINRNRFELAICIMN